MIRNGTIVQGPFDWPHPDNCFFRATTRKLSKVRPPLSGKHRRLGRQAGNSGQGQPAPGEAGYDHPSQGEPQKPNELDDEFEPGDDLDTESETDEPESDIDGEEGNDDVEDNFDDDYDLPPLPPIVKRIPFFTTIDNTIVREFPDWYSFALCAADDDLHVWTNNSPACGSRSRESANFFATKSFADAVDMALSRGWPEGRELLYDNLVAVQPKPHTFESEIYEVAGPIPILSIYVTGDPACMQDWQHDRRATNPIIKIDFSIAKSWNITPQTVAQRGAAVISLANNLEQQGHSVELRLIDYRTSHPNINGPNFVAIIPFKSAGEMLDLDRAAFAIAHASTLRRLCFAIVEQHPELQQGFYYGMGLPQQKPFKPLSDPSTIYIPNATRNETLAESRTAVEQAASAFFNRNEGREA